MVNAMHAGSDQDFIEELFQPERQAHIAVLKHGVGLERELIGGIRPKGDAQQGNLQDTKSGGEGDFAKMKAEGGGDVEVGVHMMDVVKAPEDGNFVISPVPIIKGDVHEQE